MSLGTRATCFYFLFIFLFRFSSLFFSSARAIDFLSILHNLKATKRTGWIRKGVSGPESIADHMYRMSVMAMIAGDEGVDRNKCIK